MTYKARLLFLFFIPCYLFSAGEPIIHPKGVMVDVVYWGDWMDAPIKFKSKKSLKVMPLQTGVTCSFFYEDPSPLILFREEKADPVTGKKDIVPLFTIPINQQTNRLLLIFSPDLSSISKLNVNAVILDKMEFPENSALVINQSIYDLRLKIDEQSLAVNKTKKINLILPVGKTNVPLLGAAEWNGGWLIMVSDVLSLTEGERALIYFYTNQSGDTVNSRIITLRSDSACFNTEGLPIETGNSNENYVPVAPITPM